MKKKIIYTPWILLFAALSGIVISCTDLSKDHYQVSQDVTERVNLWELISQQPNLSIFAELLKKTSYDLVLSGDQTYTVWAPVNDALAGIDENDSIAVIRLVTNHIARYIYSASSEVDNIPVIYMLSAKKMNFTRSGDSYSMGGVDLLQKNAIAKNGILHTLGKQLAFDPSIWQFMEANDYDSIRSYMYSFDTRQFIRSASKPVDYNDEGMIVYDSVFLAQNALWYVYTGAIGVGWLNNEDSLYTMIMPNNAAWSDVYNRTVDYFKPNPNGDNPDSVQRANTCYSIVQDLVFRGAVNPSSYGGTDTLFSTRYAPFLDPVRLFSGSQPVAVSNGLVYPASHLNYELGESCIKPVKVEAEWSSGRWQSEAQDFSRITAFRTTDIPDVSNNAYLYVTSVSSSVNPSVSFELPNVLAAEYDIYCTFLAQSYVQQIQDTSRYVTRAQFEIQQWDGVTDKSLSAAWKTYKLFSDQTTSQYVTQREGITKMLVTKNFNFPFANFNESQNVFRLKVTSVLTRTDLSSKYPQFNKDMRIDYVLLESSN